jgi:hypothetical protein
MAMANGSAREVKDGVGQVAQRRNAERGCHIAPQLFRGLSADVEFRTH